jgi:glutaredoxin-related protein
VVVVGRAQNPFVKKARTLLEKEGVRFTYLEYGSYLSGWKVRLAIKLWAGFPTFPMVFLDGTLIGGQAELARLQGEGKLAQYR